MAWSPNPGQLSTEPTWPRRKGRRELSGPAPPKFQRPKFPPKREPSRGLKTDFIIAKMEGWNLQHAMVPAMSASTMLGLQYASSLAEQIFPRPSSPNARPNSSRSANVSGFPLPAHITNPRAGPPSSPSLCNSGVQRRRGVRRRQRHHLHPPLPPRCGGSSNPPVW